jgi:hypothetical protein
LRPLLESSARGHPAGEVDRALGDRALAEGRALTLALAGLAADDRVDAELLAHRCLGCRCRRVEGERQQCGQAEEEHRDGHPDQLGAQQRRGGQGGGLGCCQHARRRRGCRPTASASQQGHDGGRDRLAVDVARHGQVELAGRRLGGHLGGDQQLARERLALLLEPRHQFLGGPARVHLAATGVGKGHERVPGVVGLEGDGVESDAWLADSSGRVVQRGVAALLVAVGQQDDAADPVVAENL